MDKKKITKQLYRFRQLIILVALCTFFAIRLPNMFFTMGNFTNILYAISLYGLMICGAMLPVLVGGIDRTVSAVAALSGTVCCVIIERSGYTNQSVIIGIVAGLGIGVLSGMIHGVIVSNLNIPAFLLTLATSQVLYGLVRTITQNKLIVIMKPDLFNNIGLARILEIPVPIYILLACFGFSFFLLNKTTYGRRLYSVGGNRESSKLSGIAVKKTITIAYIMSGVMSAIAGIVLASRTQQASPIAAEGYENAVLAAIVLGGVSLRGGAGTLQGAMFGALLIGVLENGLRLMGVGSIYHNLIKGIIIIIAVAVDMYSGYKMSGLKKDNWLKRTWKKLQLRKQVPAG